MDYAAYVKSLNSGRNAEFINAWFTEDCVVDGGGMPTHGREEYIARLDRIRDGVREYARPQRIAQAGNALFAELDVDFTAERDRPDFGMKPLRAGETITVRCHIAYTLRDGRVAEMHSMHWQPGYGVTQEGSPGLPEG